MRILLLSDLHLEFEDMPVPSVEGIDVVVLAGDVHVGASGLVWALQSFTHVPVVYVLGNHEYYGHAFSRLALDLRAIAAGSNVHVLDRHGVTLGGVRFLGCTLWTDLALFGDHEGMQPIVEACMSDYEVIRAGVDASRKLRSADTLAAHRRSRTWLERELARQRRQPVVVVTHHAPSLASIDPEDHDDALCCAYASDLEALMHARGPALWLHGHVHASVDYRVGRTRVLANARGYPAPLHRNNPSFDAGRVIELEV